MKRIRTLKGPATLTFVIIICLALFNPRTAFAGGVVSSATDAALRAAMVGGGTVTFSVDGVITLTNSLTVANNTTVDGTGHSITISGGNVVRLFAVTNVNASFIHLTLANGRHVGNNGAIGPGVATNAEPGFGGAILNSGGVLALTDCLAISNSVKGGDCASGGVPNNGGAAGWGGAIYSTNGNVFATNCSFILNLAEGGIGFSGDSTGFGKPGGNTEGGAVWTTGGSAVFQTCTFDANTCRGGMSANGFLGSGPGGSGCGAAIWANSATVNVYGSQLINNFGIGADHPILPFPGAGGPGTTGGARGGAIFTTNGTITCVGSLFGTNKVVAGSAFRAGPANPAQGGAIWGHSTFSVLNCSFFTNQAIGGASAGGGTVTTGGDGSGGAIFNDSSLLLTGSLLVQNIAQGGDGRPVSGVAHTGGVGKGGAICSVGNSMITNCTLLLNVARAGNTIVASFAAPGASGFGGAFYNTNGTAALVNLTFLSNHVAGGAAAPAGGPGPGPLAPGFGGAICNTNGTLNLGNCIVAFSTTTGTNVVPSTNSFGPIVDLGNNLNTELPGFSGSGSVNGANPVLGPLDNYGGPTLTLPLMAGSPAIDAGSTAFDPATDQRGRARPFGASTDIGAYESSAPFVIRGRIRSDTTQGEVPIVCETTNATTSQGLYTLWVPAGTSTVMPADSNCVYFPANRLITTGPDQLNVDFKAYRWNTLTIESVSGGIMRLMFAGTNGQPYRIVSATDLFGDWTPVSTNTPVSSNLFDVNLPILKTERARFFRGAQ